jgi:hypothetical protein
MGIRVKPEEESMGTDLALMGEVAYELPSFKHSASTQNSSPGVDKPYDLELAPIKSKDDLREKDDQEKDDREKEQPVE